MKCFNKLIAFSRNKKMHQEQVCWLLLLVLTVKHLRGVAMRIGQISKSAFKFPNDTMYQSEFLAGIHDAATVLMVVVFTTRL